jgi:hypothetical protein
MAVSGERGDSLWAPASRTPARRVILLGASNLTRSFPTVVATARATWDEPIEIMAAMGHGRSYGQDSRVLGRKISGIFPCALWQDLQNRARVPTAALLTDIGNDLMYGVPHDRVQNWIEGCLDRLTEAGASVVITQLPVASVESLSERRFQFYRRLFIPGSPLTLEGAKSMVRSFNERLIKIGELRKIPVISLPNTWYGLDPIHIRRRFFRTAWPTMLETWRDAQRALDVSRSSIWTTAYLASLAPWEHTLFGIRRRAKQPSGRLSDGTTISLY